MRPIAINGVAWSVCLSVCVCVMATFVSPVKAAEQIEVAFGVLTRVSQGAMY